MASKVKRKAGSIGDLRRTYDAYLRAASAKRSPLAFVIVLVGLTEKALVTLLSNYFIKGGPSDYILSERGALGAFSQCADLAYCLGLISDGLRENLKTIAKIRNLFAHAHEFIDFRDPDVVKLCNELTAPKGFILKPEKGKTTAGVPTATYLMRLSTRRRVAFICSNCCLSLIAAAEKTTHRNEAGDTWKSKTPIPSKP
jgi:DNA-binding MltR family transcriptional regulator